MPVCLLLLQRSLTESKGQSYHYTQLTGIELFVSIFKPDTISHSNVCINHTRDHIWTVKLSFTFFYLGPFLHTREFYTRMETSPLPTKGWKCWPILGIHEQWALRLINIFFNTFTLFHLLVTYLVVTRSNSRYLDTYLVCRSWHWGDQREDRHLLENRTPRCQGFPCGSGTLEVVQHTSSNQCPLRSQISDTPCK